MSQNKKKSEQPFEAEEEISVETSAPEESEDPKVQEYLNMAKRVQADFDNYRKRSYEAMQNIRFEGIVSVLEKFLPCLDSIAKAKEMIKDESVLEGIDMIEREMKNALYNLEVEEIEALGKEFNPKLHNVIAVVQDKNSENNTVVNVAQAGYKLKDRIIRYAQVVVNKL